MAARVAGGKEGNGEGSKSDGNGNKEGNGKSGKSPIKEGIDNGSKSNGDSNKEGKGKGGKGDGDGNKGVKQGTVKATKRAMATATRVAGNQESAGNGDCNCNSNESGG
jgi:hypothetical protein